MTDYFKNLLRYRTAAFEYLSSRAMLFTQDIDNGLDSALRTISNLPLRPPSSDTYNAILGIKSVLEQRLLCLKLLHERLNKDNSNNLHSLDYLIDKSIRDLNKLPLLPINSKPYQGLFILDKLPPTTKKYNSPTIYKTNIEGINLMHKYEGLELKAYKDPGSKNGLPITIG